MTLPSVGHAVIVNNVSSEMPGTQRDVTALRRAYETLGFRVHVHEDCSAQVRTVENSGDRSAGQRHLLGGVWLSWPGTKLVSGHLRGSRSRSNCRVHPSFGYL